MTTTEALLSHCIDYTGLFPPALLDLETTIQNYEAYRVSPHAWALGRLVLPTNRIVEFTETWPSFAAEWPISLLASGDIEAELRHANDYGLHCDVVECKPLPVDEIATVRGVLPAAATVYFEVAAGSDPEESIIAIAAADSRAKIRTGGVTQDAIPSVSNLVRFLSCCEKHEVPFKATAGLHHPIRAVHPLTYQPQSDSAFMHGYVNVILASAILYHGGDVGEASALLEDVTPANFQFDQEHVGWRDWNFTEQRILQVREDLMVSFGSCSFTEPLEEIVSMRSLS
jgi:hypothetical protein